ncbi:MAG: methylmalonyl-CoA mutase family protein [Planctomycetota bacterium]|nr:methylmalonyl-CoA mutase family protein [Planctomycetota bacterium]
MRSSAREDWERGLLAKALETHPERRDEFTTSSGVTVERVYDAPGLPLPGVFPFTRGIQPSMYRSRFWTMRQYAGFGSPEATNERFRMLLEEGQTALSIAFDLPTQIGYDSDHALAHGEVGKVGVPINTLDDMDRLLEGIALDRISISMTINTTAILLLALLIATARRRGVDPSTLRGTVQNDILKEYVARGTYLFPPQPSIRLTVDIFEHCLAEMPRFHPISISGYHIREAGATAVEEVALTLSHGIAYMEAARDRRLDLSRLGEKISFFFSAHNHLFEEVAKFRAARRLWASIMRERFGCRSEKGCALRFHTQTAGSTLTATQWELNTIRVTIQALAAILGGTQSLHTNSRDEALGLPTEESATLALRIQQVLAHESGVADSVDPIGGAPMLEALTAETERKVLELLAEIDQKGGAVTALGEGFQRHRIEESAYRYQMGIESGDRSVVGVNIHETNESASPPAFRVDPEIEKARSMSLAEHRRRRDSSKVDAALQSVRQGAEGKDNLVPILVEAIEVGVTLGEICGVLREVFGEEPTLET